MLMCARAASCGTVQAAASVRDEHAAFGGGASSLHLIGPHTLALQQWRQERRGGQWNATKSFCVVLSHTGNLPGAALLHNPPSSISVPAFTPLLLINSSGQAAALHHLKEAGVGAHHIITNPHPSVGGAVSLLQERGATRISLEAGPTTTRCLYDGSGGWHALAQSRESSGGTSPIDTAATECPACPVDWLFLGLFRPNACYKMHESTTGRLSIKRTELERYFNAIGHEVVETTADGKWVFRVYRNKLNMQQACR
jgi:hypothetical protein